MYLNSNQNIFILDIYIPLINVPMFSGHNVFFPGCLGNDNIKINDISNLFLVHMVLKATTILGSL